MTRRAALREVRGAGAAAISFLLGLTVGAAGCDPQGKGAPNVQATPTDGDAARRARMVETQIVARGVRDPRVLDAMRKVPRHLFVAPEERAPHVTQRGVAGG